MFQFMIKFDAILVYIEIYINSKSARNSRVELSALNPHCPNGENGIQSTSYCKHYIYMTNQIRLKHAF